MIKPEHKTFIQESLNQAMSLSDLQKTLAEKFDLRMTYLELRLLAAELEVDWKKLDKPSAPEPEPAPDAESDEFDEFDEDEDFADLDEEESPADAAGSENPARGKTVVSLSKLVRPGTALSGDVEFSSGAKGEWYVDNLGRLGFHPAEGSAQPDQTDLQEFQTELQKALGAY